MCIIYDLALGKRRKVLTSTDCESDSFTAVSFAKSTEKLTQYLVTLTGAPDYRVIVWIWEKQRCVAQYKFESFTGSSMEKVIPSQASFHPSDPTTLLVTGKNVYKFFKVTETAVRIMHNDLIKKSKCAASTHYTCHLWMEKRIIICTV